MAHGRHQQIKIAISVAIVRLVVADQDEGGGAHFGHHIQERQRRTLQSKTGIGRNRPESAGMFQVSSSQVGYDFEETGRTQNGGAEAEESGEEAAAVCSNAEAEAFLNQNEQFFNVGRKLRLLRLGRVSVVFFLFRQEAEQEVGNDVMQRCVASDLVRNQRQRLG